MGRRGTVVLVLPKHNATLKVHQVLTGNQYVAFPTPSPASWLEGATRSGCPCTTPHSLDPILAIAEAREPPIACRPVGMTRATPDQVHLITCRQSFRLGPRTNTDHH